MENKPTMNKRGDISITLLVVGVFVVCTLAIVSFLLHDKVEQGDFADLELLEGLSSKMEDFYFYINSGLSPNEAAERIGAEIQDGRLILNAEQVEITGVFRKKMRTVLSAQYIVNLNE